MDGDPVWSPDGTRIAFESGREDGTSDVYLMNADGSNRVQLTRGSTGNLLPAWSPDGARSEEHTSELQSRLHLVCRLLLEKKKNSTLMRPLGLVGVGQTRGDR